MGHPDKVVMKSSPADRTEHSVFRKQTSALEKEPRAGGSPDSDSG